jgi:probable rRNA maturation factor
LTDADEPGKSLKSKRQNPKARIRIVVTGCEPDIARILARAGRRTLELEKHSGTLEIHVLGSAAMAREHRTWMGIRGATDILTFDLRDQPGPRTIEGQLLVCRDVARTTAKRLGYDWKRELALYVVHGCLHLCGRDDQTPADYLRIHRREKEIFSALGWTPISP